jgi:hypothetical protein
MEGVAKPQWILLEYDSGEILEKSLIDRAQRLLLYPAVGPMQQGAEVDIRIALGDSNILFPLRAAVVEVRTRPKGPDQPRGVVLAIAREDQGRFDRLLAFMDGVWRPSGRRESPRYPIELKASYRYPKDKFPAETTDLSVRGAFLRTEGLLPEPGSVIQVKLNPGRLRSSLALAGEVRWLDRVDGRRGMGLLFTGPAEELVRLANLVDKIVQQTRA